VQTGYVLFCATCGSNELDVGYYEDPGGPLILGVECLTCGATGQIEGLSVASLKIRAEKNDELMLAATELKHMAIGAPEGPSDDDVERWAKDMAGEEHREITDLDIKVTRMFLEAFPEALAAEGRAKKKGKRAEYRRIFARGVRKQDKKGVMVPGSNELQIDQT